MSSLTNCRKKSDMTPYDLRRQLWETARENVSVGKLDDDKLDDLIDALVVEFQSYILSKLGLAR